MAVTVTGKSLEYYPWEEEKRQELNAFLNLAKSKKWTVGAVYKAMMQMTTVIIPHNFDFFAYLIKTVG
jgi:hypothetical protein